MQGGESKTKKEMLKRKKGFVCINKLNFMFAVFCFFVRPFNLSLPQVDLCRNVIRPSRGR